MAWPRRSANTGDMGDRTEMRASDGDRDRVADVLRDAHGEGRLTQDELMSRVEAAYDARSYHQLDRLIADLPVNRTAAPRPSRVAPAVAPVRRGLGRRMARVALTVSWWIYSVALAINLTVWMLVSASNGGPEYFWPMWVAVPWGLVIGAGELAYRSYVPSSPPSDP